MLASYCKKLTSAIGSYFRQTRPNDMATTCILVVGLPMALCMFFVVYAIFIVPGLEKSLKEGVDLPGGHHLAAREYLYMVYWAVAASIMIISTSLGIVKLCKCQVKDFEEQYGSPRVAMPPVGGKMGAFGGKNGGSGTSRTPTMSTILTEGSPFTLRAPPCPKVTATPQPVQPPVASLPISMSVMSPPVSEPGSFNRGFVFGDDDDDEDDELAKALEMRLSSARVLPLAKSFDPIAANRRDSGSDVDAADGHGRRTSRSRKVQSLLHPELGRRGSQMGHRWRSMPLERGFSMAWDDDLGLDAVQPPDDLTTPEDVDEAFSPDLIVEEDEGDDESQKYLRRAEWIGSASISLQDETQPKSSGSRAGTRKKRLSASGIATDAGTDDGKQSLSSSSDSFGSLLEAKRLFSVTEATPLSSGAAGGASSSTRAAIARAMAAVTMGATSSPSATTFPTTFEEEEAATEAEIREAEYVMARKNNASKSGNYWQLVDLTSGGEGLPMSPRSPTSASTAHDPSQLFTAAEDFDFAKSGLFDFPESSSSSDRNGASSRENNGNGGNKNGQKKGE